MVDHLAEIHIERLLVLGQHLRAAGDTGGAVAVACGENGYAVADHAVADNADMFYTVKFHNSLSSSMRLIRKEGVLKFKLA